MFKHIFINRLKVLLRTKSAIFWTLVFPIILATFFNLAFGNIAEEEKFEPFNMAIIQNENYEKEVNFKAVVETLSADSDDKMFNVQYVSNKEQANKLLDDNEIKGYLEVDLQNKIGITVKENGAVQTILKSIVDNYYQTYSMIENIAQINPQVLTSDFMSEFDNNNFDIIVKSVATITILVGIVTFSVIAFIVIVTPKNIIITYIIILVIYSIFPCPYGWLSSAGLEANLLPTIATISVIKSLNE